MSEQIADNCQDLLKNLEDELLWAICSVKKSDLPNSIMRDMINYLAMSCRFKMEKTDEKCKKILAGYEDEILHLSMHQGDDALEKLTAVHAKIRLELN